MKEFLLSLVLPLRIKRYRYMTVFVSILIFVVSVYLIAIPNQYNMKMNKNEYLSQQLYVNAYMQLPEDISLPADFIAAGYKVNKDNQMVSTSSSKEIKKYYFENISVKLYDEDEKQINIHLVFDLENQLTKTLEKIGNEYKEFYPKDSDDKVSYAQYLTYVEWIKLSSEEATESWKNTKYEELHNEDEESLKEKMALLTNFDLFNINIDSSENDYMLMFFKDHVVSQIPKYDEKAEKNIYPSRTYTYVNKKMSLFFAADTVLDFDFSNKTNLKEFGNYFVQKMFDPISYSDQTSYLLQIVGYVIIFPAIFVLLMCWSMRKRGILKKYKEYYNVASICSIIPVLITFVLGWFVPKIVPVYGALFCLYSLFVYIKINSTPELVD